MKEIRKRVSDLVVGDNVKGYGVLLDSSENGPPGEWYVKRAYSYEVWPADAEVTVLVPEKRWRVTLVFSDPFILEHWQERVSAPTAYLYDSVTIEEVDA